MKIIRLYVARSRHKEKIGGFVCGEVFTYYAESEEEAREVLSKRIAENGLIFESIQAFPGGFLAGMRAYLPGMIETS